MVNKLKTIILLLFVFSVAINSQTDTSNCCPEGFTGNVNVVPNVMYANLFVEDSLKFSSQPRMVDSISSVLGRLYESLPKPLIYAGFEGRLFVSISIRSDGSIDSCRVIKGIIDEIDSSALDVLKTINFVPARIGKQNVPSEVMLQFNYGYTVDYDEPSFVVDDIILDYKPVQVYHYLHVVFKSDLTAYYEEIYPDTTYRFDGIIDEYYYQRLNDLIHSICFFKLQDSYASEHTHSGGITLTVSQGDVTKSIILGSNLPVGLWSLHELINYLKDDLIEWRPIL